MRGMTADAGQQVQQQPALPGSQMPLIWGTSLVLLSFNHLYGDPTKYCYTAQASLITTA